MVEQRAMDVKPEGPEEEAGIEVLPGLEVGVVPDNNLHLEWLNPYDLQANPLNPRTHPQAQRRALHASLTSLGWVQPLLLNARTGRLIDGHMRRQQAIESGITEVPVLVVDLDEHDERTALASIDSITSLATVDNRAMDALLESIRLHEPELTSALEETEQLMEQGVFDIPAPPATNRVHLVPGERYNYVMLLFRTEIDWLAAMEHFDIGEPAIDMMHNSRVVGRTRVIEGSEYLGRVLKKAS